MHHDRVEIEQGPVSRVFATCELLEHILLHLSIEDVITARGVNNYWKDTISTSPSLQVKLFLTADPATIHHLHESSVERDEPSKDALRDKKKFKPARLNDTLFNKLDQLEHPSSFQLRREPDLRKVNSVYRNMLICQPPPSRVEFYFYYRERSDRLGMFRFSGVAKNKDGVRFGDLLRAFEDDMVIQHPELTVEGVRRIYCGRREGHGMAQHRVFETGEAYHRWNGMYGLKTDGLKIINF